MTRLGFFILALGACALSPTKEPPPPATGSGDMRLAENTGGLCGNSPWCGYDLVFDGTALVVTSRSTPATGTGTLTAVGLLALDDLVAELPYDAPDDTSDTCADAPTIRLHVKFDEVGDRTFQYTCEPGVFAPLGAFVTRLANAVINYEPDETVVVDAPF